MINCLSSNPSLSNKWMQFSALLWLLYSPPFRRWCHEKLSNRCKRVILLNHRKPTMRSVLVIQGMINGIQGRIQWKEPASSRRPIWTSPRESPSDLLSWVSNAARVSLHPGKDLLSSGETQGQNVRCCLIGSNSFILSYNPCFSVTESENSRLRTVDTDEEFSLHYITRLKTMANMVNMQSLQSNSLRQ